MYQECHKRAMIHGQDEDARCTADTQASGDTVSTIDDCSSVTGTTPTTNGTSSQGTASQGQRYHLGRDCTSTRVELFTPTAMCKLTSTCMIGSSSIHAH